MNTIEYVGGPLDGETYDDEGPSKDRPFPSGYYAAAMNGRRYWKQELAPPAPPAPPSYKPPTDWNPGANDAD